MNKDITLEDVEEFFKERTNIIRITKDDSIKKYIFTCENGFNFTLVAKRKKK